MFGSSDSPGASALVAVIRSEAERSPAFATSESSGVTSPALALEASERFDQREQLVVLDVDAGPERRLERARGGRGDGAPAGSVEERGEGLGAVDARLEYCLPDARIGNSVIRNRLTALDLTGVDWRRVGPAAKGLSHSEITPAAEQAAKAAIWGDGRSVDTQTLVGALQTRHRDGTQPQWLSGIALTSS